MSQRDWRKYLAPRRLAAATFVVGLMLWCAVALIQYRSEHARQRDDAAQYHANDSFEQRPPFCTHIPSIGVYSCSVDVSQADPDAREARRSEYDLQAQQEMAEWAFVMMLATIAGVLTTVVGLLYVVRAYRLNAVATEHASAAAQAATAQATTANEAFAAERRPWVAVDDVRLTELDWNAETWQLGLTVVVMLRNTGESPALNVQIHTDCTGEVDLNVLAQLRSEMRERARRGMPHGLLEQTIFPGAPPRPNQWSVSINREKIEALRNAWSARLPEGHASRGNIFVAPTVYGVVGYRSRYDAEVHTTGFMITYMQEGHRMLVFDPTQEVELPPVGDLRGITIYGGWDAD